MRERQGPKQDGVAMVMAAKPGAFTSIRTPKRRSGHKLFI